MKLTYTTGGFWHYSSVNGVKAETIRCGPFGSPRIQISDGTGNYLRVAFRGQNCPWEAKPQIEAAMARFAAGERGDADAIPAPAPSLHPLDVGFEVHNG